MRYIKSFANDAAIQAAVDNKTLGKPYVALNDATGKIDWNGKDETDYSKMYFTIEALQSNNYRLIGDTGKRYSYSVNGGEWIEVSGGKTISLSAGDAVSLKSTDGLSDLLGGIPDFNAYGNILSLKYGDNFMGIKDDSYKLSFAFTNIVDASNLVLPATTLTENCYESMFAGCTKLIYAPALPATTLARSCYENMFTNCVELTTAPELYATFLATSCYSNMFGSCTSLNCVKCLATDISAEYCIDGWLSGVSSTGTFVKKAGVTWPTGNSGIPSGWTVVEE